MFRVGLFWYVHNTSFGENWKIIPLKQTMIKFNNATCFSLSAQGWGDCEDCDQISLNIKWIYWYLLLSICAQSSCER